MICIECDRNEALENIGICPDCWPPKKPKWNPSAMGSSGNRAIKHRGAVRAAERLKLQTDHAHMMELRSRLMEKFFWMYDYEDPYLGWFERDSVTTIEERALVSSVVAAIILAFFVLNEVFGFINY